MSRSVTASTPKIPSQLPPKSVWARGPPPQNSATTASRSQSPAPPTPVSSANPASFHATHSRRPSALGQGVSVKDGVNIPRNAVKQDDAPAPISSSPASAPAVKPVEVCGYQSTVTPLCSFNLIGPTHRPTDLHAASCSKN
ncbi:hypothetical protein F5148DRAFT_35896 [Russula earlei]|uniref:Uncharacterized protein n=1 Tax=Russula earlei TaxID=71964 RepID=A0ACC0UA98_9AGAM|nr:hypothetical protein F5148DRAFT_35896 [Russula earlei]